MRPARRPPGRRNDVRLLTVDPAAPAGLDRLDAVADRRIDDLPDLLRSGDLVVVNDAATLPASLSGIGPEGQPVEARLLDAGRGAERQAVVFGAGSWRDPTENRPAPDLREGDWIDWGDDVGARVVAVSPTSPRLVRLRFNRDGGALWAALYRLGSPVQYSYLDGELDLWDVQTVYGSRPWASEMPSAGRSLTWANLLGLRRVGVELAAVTHAAGLSSSGEPALDAALPLPERYEVPEGTVRAVERAVARAGRVVAIGTTVVRALEGNARNHGGALVAESGTTDLVIDGRFRPRIVDGLVSGMHAPSESHFQLLRAFASEEVLLASWRRARDAGYRCHEFGDATLVLPGVNEQAAPLVRRVA